MPQATTRPTRETALLLYMAGDNDLSDAGLRDIQELCDEGASEDLYVAAEIDTRGEHTGSIRYEITEREADENGRPRAYRKVIQRLEEQDTGKPSTLLSFLKWGIRRYPARRYVIVIGGHGDGFRRQGRAIAVDEFGSSLDMSEIEYVFKRAGLSGQRIGILGFDACLMGILEIAHHLSPFAEVLVCSQAVEPGDGWPYAKVLQHLKGMHTADGGPVEKLEGAGEGIADSYAGHYQKSGITDVTQSVIRLSKTEAAMRSLSTLGDRLNSLVTDAAADERRDVVVAVDSVRSRTQCFRLAEYVDAIHLAEGLENAGLGKQVSNASAALRKALKAAIVANQVPRKTRRLKDAHGLSVWFPPTPYSYVVNRARYCELSGVAAHSGWIDFLDVFFETLRHRMSG